MKKFMCIVLLTISTQAFSDVDVITGVTFSPFHILTTAPTTLYDMITGEGVREAERAVKNIRKQEAVRLINDLNNYKVTNNMTSFLEIKVQEFKNSEKELADISIDEAANLLVEIFIEE